MLNFIDELRDTVLDSTNDAERLNELKDVLSMIDSLGENARRMLEIGILQDELHGLGFRRNPDNYRYINYGDQYHPCLEITATWNFYSCFVYKNKGNGFQFFYNTPTWQQNVLNRIKELINEK